MNRRLLFCTSVLGLLGIVGLCLASLPGLESAGLDFWNIPRLDDTRAAEERKAEEYKAEAEVILRRLEIKRVITDEVIEGRLTLLQAAARFHEADFDRTYLHLLPGRTWQEQLCHNVIRWVSACLADDPAKQTQVVARLHAELAEHLDAYGEVTLPQPN